MPTLISSPTFSQKQDPLPHIPNSPYPHRAICPILGVTTFGIITIGAATTAFGIIAARAAARRG